MILQRSNSYIIIDDGSDNFYAALLEIKDGLDLQISFSRALSPFTHREGQYCVQRLTFSCLKYSLLFAAVRIIPSLQLRSRVQVAPKKKELKKMVTSEELDMTFQKVGNDFGIQTKAEFAAYHELKVRWMRTYQWAEFTVSDYLKEAPLNVVEGIARTIFNRIKGKECEYPEDVSDWLTSEEFTMKMQPSYIKRDRRIGSEEGQYKDIQESLARLKDMKLIPEDLGHMRFFWSAGTSDDKSAWSSMLMKVVTINKALDLEDVPDEVLDYVIFNQIVYVNSDFNMTQIDRKNEVARVVRNYPGFDAINEWLEDHRFSL